MVERHRGTAIHPRAALVSQRTMETYRAVGLQEEIEEAAAREFVQNGAIVSVESLGGKELDWYFRTINEGVEDISPCARLFVTQIGLEPILLAKAKELGSRIEYASEAVAIEQDGDGVTATIRPRDGGDDWTVRAQYAIGADGPHSPTRERLGIGQLGHGSFSDSITIYFRADVSGLLGDRNLSVIYVFNPRLVGFFRFSIDGQAGFLVVNATVDEDGNRSTSIGEDMSEETCIAYVRTALGAPDLPVHIENVQRWSASAEWAERFTEGRVFLAGDSAHVMPPTGGFGGNTGVQDAYDLAWKLAAVLDGTAGPALLDTYDVERRPVGEFATEQAYTRYVLRLDPAPRQGEPDAGRRTRPTVELGYRLPLRRRPGRSPATTARSGRARTSPPAGPGCARRTSGSSGTARRSRCSTCSGRGSSSSPARRATRGARPAGTLGADAYRVGADFEDAFRPVRRALRVGDAGAALIRPDGFVAWRSREAGDDAEGMLKDALARALCKT